MAQGLAPGLDAVVEVIPRLVERLIASDVPLEREPLVELAAALIAEEAPLAEPSVAAAAVDALLGLGPLQPLVDDLDISDILVNGPDEIWVERGGELSRVEGVRFGSGAEMQAAVERVIGPLGLRLDRASPAVDARLPDGSRLHAMIPPVSIDGPVIAIRRFTQAVASLDDLVTAGGVDQEGAEILRSAVVERSNLLVSGGTGSGKTTLLNVLSREIPAEERVVTVKDAAELQLAGHVVRLEAGRANAEGAGEVPLRDLVRHALRLRPDRIIVGEVRGAEAFELTRASNAGCGFSCTVHANSARDALNAIVNAALMAGENVTETVVRKIFTSTIDFVVYLGRDSVAKPGESLRRQTMEILAVAPTLSDDFTTDPVFLRNGIGSPLTWTGHMPVEALTRRVESALPDGVSLKAICEGTVNPL